MKAVLLALVVVIVAGVIGYFVINRDDLGELQKQCGRTAQGIQTELGVRAALRCSVDEGQTSQLDMVHVQVTLYDIPTSLTSEDARLKTEALIRRSMKQVSSVGFDLKQLEGSAPTP